MVALTRQATRTAHHVDPAKLAEAGREVTFAGNGGIVGIELHVTRNKQVEKPVVIVIAPGCTRRPSAHGDSGLIGNIGKSSVVVVVVEAVLAEIGDIYIGPSVVIVIANHSAEAPPLVSYSSLVGDVSECAVVIIVEQHRARRSLLAFERGKRGTIHQINVEPSVVIIVEERHPGSGRLQNRALFGSA